MKKFVIIVLLFMCGCVKKDNFFKDLGAQKAAMDTTVYLKRGIRSNVLSIKDLKKEWSFVVRDSTFPLPLLKHKIFIYFWSNGLSGYLLKQIGISLRDSTALDLNNYNEFNKMVEHEDINITNSLKAFEEAKWWLSGFFDSQGKGFLLVANVNDIIQYERENPFWGHGDVVFDLNKYEKDRLLNNLKQELQTVKDSLSIELKTMENGSFRIGFSTWNNWTLSRWEIAISQKGLILSIKEKTIADFISVRDKYSP